MANAEGANFSTLSSQDQNYLTRLQHQTHTLHQRRHQSMTSGAPGFQPNAWGCPESQIVYTEDSYKQARDEKYLQAAYYDETARSFSAAAAVAAVAAAAYISSSNAVVSSGHYPDSKSIKYESMEGEKSINSLQENSGACKAGFAGSSPEACGCSVKPMNFGAPTSGPPAPEAHSNSVHFLSTLTDISCPGTVPNLSKFPPFINGTEARSYAEVYETRSQAYISPSAIPDPASSSSVTPSRKRADKPPAHVKKPLNAFMLFMKEMRAKVVAECTMKESAAINQILGRKWHALPHEEQAKFYEMARKEKEIHQRMYPGWSARDNYAYHAKRRKNRSRYRVYNNSEMLAEQAKQMKEATSPPGGSEAVAREKASLTAPVGLGGVLRGSAFYRSPFALGQFGGCGGRSGGGAGSEQGCAAPEEAMPYFGGIEHHQQPSYREQRQHHHLQQHHHQQQQQQHQQQQQQQQHHSQQPFFLNISPTEPSGGVKEEEEEEEAETEEGKNRLACTFSKCVDLISPAQHFTPSANWLLTTGPNATVSHAVVNHRCQLAYDTISSASTSPWSQTHQQVEERFQRQLTHPTCGVIAPNQYSTPPYNPNGNFDYRYGDLNLAYISTQKASPMTTTLESDGSLRSVLAYEAPESKSSLFQPEYGGQTCEEGPSTASTYGFSSS